MAQGISIHISSDQPGAAEDSVWGRLYGCPGDIAAMRDLAAAVGFDPHVITGKESTTTGVLNAIRTAGSRMCSEDILLITYTGHGIQVRDRTGDSLSGWIEAWCLDDRPLVNRELYEVWSAFPPGARVLIVSDSCFSGGMLRGRLREQPPPEAPAPAAVVAEVLLLSATQDNEPAVEGDDNGAFTAALLEVWNGGVFQGTYVDLHREIYERLAPDQHPQLVALEFPAFVHQRPFTI